MECLRCHNEMKHYELKPDFKIYGLEHQPSLFSAKTQLPHHIHSVYICDNCGYVEFSTKLCEKSDI